MLLYGAVVLALLGTVETSKPHIIHIIADDYGWADVGYHRNDPKDALPEVITPVLDELARTGLELDRFYVHKICSPSRCAVQSGRHPINVNVQNVVPEVSNPEVVTLLLHCYHTVVTL
jgi:arylsulfatase I/J